MNYAESARFLYSLGNEIPTAKFGLERITRLLGALGNPERSCRWVHVAGTNGKGSTSAMIESGLRAAGVSTGLYTSPHLVEPTERIQVRGETITPGQFAEACTEVHEAAERMLETGDLDLHPTYFETVTAMAFLIYSRANLDIVVLEVGMGGRLDATNVVDPLISVITDISLDHMEWLGSTISAITREKAGILRKGGTMVTLPQHPEANEVLGEVATELGVRAVGAAAYLPEAGAVDPYLVEVLGAEIVVDSPLAGEHQHRNLALAIAAAAELRDRHRLSITPAAMERGIRQTHWPGRLERLERDGLEWVLDVAHNPAGAWALRAGLRELMGEERPMTLIFSCLRDKPVAEMAQIMFPVFRRVILAPIRTARGAGLDELMAAAKATGTAAVVAKSVGHALEIAREGAQSAAGEVMVVSGSAYLVGEARPLLVRAEGRRR